MYFSQKIIVLNEPWLKIKLNQYISLDEPSIISWFVVLKLNDVVSSTLYIILVFITLQE